MRFKNGCVYLFQHKLITRDRFVGEYIKRIVNNKPCFKLYYDEYFKLTH